MKNEIWKDIKDYPNSYQISSFGRIRSLDKTVTFIRNGNVYPRKIKGKILTPTPSGRGYLQTLLTKEGKGKMHTIHRLVAEAFIPKESNNLVVNHIDGDKLNNNVSNLEWVTQSDNIKQSYDKLGNIPWNKRYGPINQTYTKIDLIVDAIIDNPYSKNKVIAEIVGETPRRISKIKHLRKEQIEKNEKFSDWIEISPYKNYRR